MIPSLLPVGKAKPKSPQCVHVLAFRRHAWSLSMLELARNRIAPAWNGDSAAVRDAAHGHRLSTGGIYLFTLFYGIWMLNVVGASTKAVSIAFLLSGVCNALGGVLGGRLSDRFGRRAVLGGASVTQLSAATVLLPSHPPIALAVVAFALNSLAGGSGTAGSAAIVDLTDDEQQRTEYFSANRVIENVGATVAPVLGSVLILAGWWALHVVIVLTYVVTILSRFRLPALRGDSDEAEAPSGNALSPLRDGRLRVFLLGAVACGATYGAFEILLPISLTRDHGFAPALWECCLSGIRSR